MQGPASLLSSLFMLACMVCKASECQVCCTWTTKMCTGCWEFRFCVHMVTRVIAAPLSLLHAFASTGPAKQDCLTITLVRSIMRLCFNW